MKPLFIPLMREYFEAFETGKKTAEYRPYGPRWNEKTCFPGREVTLSLGYGKHRRLKGIIEEALIAPEIANKTGWKNIYGKTNRQPYAIKIRIINDGK